MTILEPLQNTIGDRAYDRLRADIVFGRLAPGAKLTLDRLGKHYGASVSTVREILSRLNSAGLVAADESRGYRVSPVSPAGLDEVAEMRLLFEAHAIPLSFADGDLEWEAGIVAAHHKLATLERRLLAGDRSAVELWKRYDREFHLALVAACGSETLIDLYGEVFDKFLRYQMIAAVFRGEVAAAEHRRLVDCALARDAGAANAILEHHVRACVDHTLSIGLPAADRAEAAGQGPVAGSAYREIRRDIVFGRLPPGTWLKLDAMKAQYGSGMSTIREILSRLQSERLVVAEGQKGFSVAPISAANLKEIAALRRLLESRAMAQSFRFGGVEWEARVVAAHHRLARAEARMAAGDRTETGDWKNADWQFHQALISACGSRLLIDTHAAVFDKYLRYQMIALSYRGEIAAQEHADLLACALSRDVARAAEVLASHVEGGVAHALATGTIGG